MKPGEFLHLLWGRVSIAGAITLWFGTSSKSEHIALGDLARWDDEDDAYFADHGENVYTSPGLRRLGVERQGRQQDIVALAGYVLDLDMAHGRHKANERLDRALAVTDDDVAAILGDGPDPSLVVNTGGGFHFWWLFEEPWLLPDAPARARAKSGFKEFHSTYLARGKKLGFWIDPGLNTIQAQFRLPGTKNRKHDPPVDVCVVYQSDSRLPLPRPPVVVSTLAPAPAVETPLSKELAAVREAMKKLRPDHEHKEAMKLVLQGKSFAEPGGRNDTMYRVVSTIAWLTPARMLASETLVELLRPSLTVWANEPGAEKTLDEEIEVATAMFESAIENRKTKDEENARGLEGIARWMRGSLRANDEPIAEDDTEAVPDRVAIQCSIVQYRTNYWAHCFDENRLGYLGPFIKDELWTQLKNLWSEAPDSFQLYGEKGKAKTVLEIVQEHGVGALDVVGHLFLQQSYFDVESWIFHRAMCPFRVLEPRFDPQIDEWLRLMGGDKADKLLDWFAGLPRLDRQQCSLYLETPPGVGKNLVAEGCAKLWRESGPSSFINIMGGFNADMFACPLILLDEGLPSRASHTSAFIRNLVGSSDHTWSQKFQPTYKVLGCVRLIIAANNDKVLAQLSNEDMGEVDVEAMTERFLHIQGDDKAAEWIRKTNAIDRRIIDRWKSESLLAKHIIWLAEHRDVVEGRRFLTDGEATEMHRSLITRGEKQGLVLEWLARFLLDPNKVERKYKDSKREPLARVGNGQILVNTNAIVEQWTIYRDHKIAVTPAEIGRILTSLSHKKRQLGVRGDRIKYHLVNWENVRRVADDLQFNIEDMERNIHRKADFEIEPGPQLKLVP